MSARDREGWLVVSDIDDTLTGDRESLNQLWAALRVLNGAVRLALNSSRRLKASAGQSAKNFPLILRQTPSSAVWERKSASGALKSMAGAKGLTSGHAMRLSVSSFPSGIFRIPTNFRHQARRAFPLQIAAMWMLSLRGFPRVGFLSKSSIRAKATSISSPPAPGRTTLCCSWQGISGSMQESSLLRAIQAMISPCLRQQTARLRSAMLAVNCATRRRVTRPILQRRLMLQAYSRVCKHSVYCPTRLQVEPCHLTDVKNFSDRCRTRG